MGKTSISLGIAVLSFLLLLTMGYVLLRPRGYSNVEILNDGWNVTYNDESYENVQLSKLRKIVGSGSAKGDKITLIKNDVDLSAYEAPTIMFESRFSGWAVYANSKELEERFLDAYENGKFIGCENNFVSLPKSFLPINLEIDLYVAEDGAYNYYTAPAVGGYYDLLLYEIYRHMFVFLISAFLIVFGIVFFGVAIGFRSGMAEVRMQIFAALL